MVKFGRGDTVEICSKEDGFKGSYFKAIIVEAVEKNKYLVEYTTLITDDHMRFLRETVDAIEIRPSPPIIRVSDFRLLDQVDVYDNDGWWVGRITGRDVEKYYVYFDRSTGETIWYRFSQLRVHQEWENGKWVPSQKS